MPFTVACAQFAPEKAEVGRNLDRIAQITRQAVGEGAALVVFPEAATTGYFLEGGVLEASLSIDELISELASRSAGLSVDVVIGFYERDGGNLYNSAAYLSIANGAVEPVKVYRKFFLPTYGVFDEERFVSRGHDLGVFETQFGRVGLLICEDVWHSVLPTLAAAAGAQMLLVPSASPARGFRGPDIDNHDRYRRLFRGICEEHGVFCVNTQLCGFEGGKGLVGGSMVVDPFGRTVVEAPILQEALVLAQIDLDLVTIARAQTPLVSDLQTAWGDIQRLAQSIQP